MDWKTIGKRLLFPPVWLMVFLLIFSTAGLGFIFFKNLSHSPVAYPVYAIAFYTLCVLSAFGAIVLPKRYRAIRKRLHANPAAHRYLSDAAFKVHVKLYTALTANLLFASANILFWLLYRSMWFVVLAVYYAILAVMRFLLVRYVRTSGLGKNRLGELRRARLCSCILLTVNFALTGAVMMILYQNKGFHYHSVLIYVMAGYTFYITTHAIVDLIRYRKYQSPVMTTSKIIALSAALVSMLALETAMLAQFGSDMLPEHQWLMVALTGAGVSMIVIAMSWCMIAASTRKIKEITNYARE